MDSNRSSNTRFIYLDGMRGIAAFAVLFHHFILGFEPQLAGSILHGCVQGSFAVCIFFVLSGFVMSAAAQRPEPLGLRCVKRYLRLALPMLAAATAAWLLLLVFPKASQNLVPVTGSGWAGAQYYRPSVPLWYVPVDSLARAFLRRDSYLDSSLWTMQPELIGSLAIFFIYWVRRSGFQLLGIAILTIVGFALPNYWMICFAAGIVFWELKLHQVRAPGPGLAAIAAGLLLSVVSGPLLARLPPTTNPWPLYVAASILMIGGILVSDRPKRWLAAPAPQFLGRISFGLYLIHVPLLLTMLAALWTEWRPSGIAIAGFLALYTLVSITAAWLMTKLADEPTLRLLKRFGRPVAWSWLSNGQLAPHRRSPGPGRAAETSSG